jgi:hypothetical protein
MSGPYCTRCGEQLKGLVVWLSLNFRTGLYSKKPPADPDDDDGTYPFGEACARRQLADQPRRCFWCELVVVAPCPRGASRIKDHCPHWRKVEAAFYRRP